VKHTNHPARGTVLHWQLLRTVQLMDPMENKQLIHMEMFNKDRKLQKGIIQRCVSNDRCSTGKQDGENVNWTGSARLIMDRHAAASFWRMEGNGNNMIMNCVCSTVNWHVELWQFLHKTTAVNDGNTHLWQTRTRYRSRHWWLKRSHLRSHRTFSYIFIPATVNSQLQSWLSHLPKLTSKQNI